MSVLRRHPLAIFSIVSLVTMAALAVTLAVGLQGRIDARALDSAASSAEILGAVAVRPVLTAHELRTTVSPQTVDALGSYLTEAELHTAGVDAVKVFDARRRLIFSSAGGPLGKAAPARSNVATAMTGQRVTSLARGVDDTGRGEQTLSVYAPLRYGPKDVAGAFEVYLDYAPTAAAARRDITAMWALVAISFVVLWLALFGLVRSVSRALRRQVDENAHQSTHDALTGLPNRALLFDRLAEAVAAGGAALLQIDLDGFREINDTFGHDHGDALLVEVAGRLVATAGPDDVVARLGGDEFAVLRPALIAEEEAAVLAAGLARSLRSPVEAGGTTLMLDASVGLALAPIHGDDPATVARHADIALHSAKERRSRVEVYDPAGHTGSRERLELLGELGAAIQRGELVVAYQPKVVVGSEEVCGVEALVRWQHPERGLLPPGAFIPAAELTSLVRPLTLFVVDQALRAHSTWRRHGLDLPVAVNLAGPCVMDLDLPMAVADLLADHNVAADALTLEISERTIMSDLDRALRVLGAFRALGVRLSLDDFGTGQTSLGQLRQLPLDEMKVDRSLVIGDERLMSSVVEIAHRFGLRSVAEGVETPETVDALVAAGCDEAQGFLFARPMWADAIPEWVAGHRRALRAA